MRAFAGCCRVSETASLHSADLVILGVLTLSLVYGFVRGFAREIIALTGWFAAVLVARWYNEPVGALLATWVETPSLRLLASYGSLFFGTLLVFGLLAQLVSFLISETALSLPNRFLGGVFGAGRGIVLVLVALVLMAPFVKDDAWFKHSSLPTFFLQYEPLVRQLKDQAYTLVHVEQPTMSTLSSSQP